jgi:hypothetical protein
MACPACNLVIEWLDFGLHSQIWALKLLYNGDLKHIYERMETNRPGNAAGMPRCHRAGRQPDSSRRSGSGN